jgi:hexosaminidase
MRKCSILPVLPFLIISLLMACNSEADHQNNLSEISISWELKYNNYSSDSHSIAIFTLKNNSLYSLESTKWKLFFSQAPRPLNQSDSNQTARVEHVNGDYYRLIPTNKFNLKPGDSIEISYEFDWLMLKETDAPRGLYFVTYDKKGKELAISPVKDYIVKPIKPAAEANSENDYKPASPEWQYLQNERIKQLPEKEWQRLIPNPVKITGNNRVITIDSTFLVVSDKDLENEASYLCEMLKSTAGFRLKTAEALKPGYKYILLKMTSMLVNGIEEESYKLSVSDSAIEIYGNDRAGVFYGIQSLLSLIPIESYKKKNMEIILKSVQIEDAPRFPYRGLHIDVCRHFQPKVEILKIIDLMAFYKLNKLHLYLTEDEGWRIEIKGLPELTQVGSKRGHCPTEDKMLNPAYGSGPDPENNQAYGSGYYSREDFIEIIQYAFKRHIQVIPGINFPGHARAAIKSMEARYRRLRSKGRLFKAKEFRLIDPNDQSVYRSAQFCNDNIVDISLESVYRFYETVVAEIAGMYKEAAVPFNYIYTGGDEVPEGAWAGSTDCIKLMQKMQIKDSRNLQIYFSERILKILEKYNLIAGGWEEIALKRNENREQKVNTDFINKNMVPYVWNNLKGAEDLGYKLANEGYPVILCCVTNFYFDQAYNSDPMEPGLYWGGYTDEYDPWIAAPYNMTRNKPGLVPLNIDSRKNILGLQAQLWSETITGPEMLEYYLLPKMISFAERAWATQPVWEEMPESKEKTKLIELQWNQFINAVSQRDLPRLNTIFDGFNYRVPPPGAIIDNGMLKANTQYPGSDIYFTTDGTNPDENSLKYIQPVKVTSEVKLVSIDKAGKRSRVVKAKFDE